MAAALAEGMLPLEYMLAVLRDATADPKDRAWAAEKCAPYLHSRPAPEPRTVTIALPDTSTIEGVHEANAAVIKAAADGEIAPSEAQHFMSMLESQRKAIEGDEVLTRLAALEEALKNR